MLLVHAVVLVRRGASFKATGQDIAANFVQFWDMNGRSDEKEEQDRHKFPHFSVMSSPVSKDH